MPAPNVGEIVASLRERVFGAAHKRGPMRDEDIRLPAEGRRDSRLPPQSKLDQIREGRDALLRVMRQHQKKETP